MLYLDCVNLFGFAMCQNLPFADFKWLTKQELRSLDLEAWDSDYDTAYILQVDIDYPHELHDSTSSYPLAPEKIFIQENQLSPKAKQLKLKLSLPKQNNKIAKLAPNLYNKYNYVVHSKLLQYYLSKGMVLRKIHKGIRFTQKPWLKAFVQSNSQKRRGAKSQFQKLFLKSQNNSLYGKLLESKTDRINMKVVDKKMTLTIWSKDRILRVSKP